MQISEQIKENRKKVGLTQEQIADSLGVSTPAVNKWERGNSFPDISLLPALARLLKIDLNTLFSFNEEITEFEMSVFIKELVDIVQKGEINLAFETAVEKIRQYPYSDKLVFKVANILDSSLVLSTIDKESKSEYSKQILIWYEQTAQSQDESIKNSAIYVLANKYIKNLDYDKAGMLIEQLPEMSIDKISFQIDIFMHKNMFEEAAVLLEGKLLQDLEKLHTNLCKLIEIERKEERLIEATKISEMAQSMISLFGLWPYKAITPQLIIALRQCDVKQSIRQIKAILDEAKIVWDMKDSPLFYRIAQVLYANGIDSFISAFLSELKSCKEYDFLRSNKEFEELLIGYQNTMDM